LHTTLAYHDVNSIKNQIHFEHYAGRLEATHFETSSVYVTFSALVGHKSSVPTVDPQLDGLAEYTQFEGPTQELYLLDGDTDDLPGKLELYIKKMGPLFYEQEPSEFMKSTLNMAAELSLQKKVDLHLKLMMLNYFFFFFFCALQSLMSGIDHKSFRISF
jgi:hypothetical protein